MYMLPAVPDFSRARQHKEERLLWFMYDIMARFDVLCLQEVFGTLTYRKERLVRVAELAGFHAVITPKPSWCRGKFADSGLITLSRFPVLESEFVSFERGAFSDKLADKGVLHTSLEIDGKILHVYNTHLNASYQTGSAADL